MSDKGEVDCDYLVWKREGSVRILSVCMNIWISDVKEMKPGSSQWCAVTGQKATDTKSLKFTTEFFTLRVFKNLSSCPERSWSLPAWRYSKPNWTWCWTAWFNWLCSEQVGWTRLSLEVPSNLIYSVIVPSSADNSYLQHIHVCFIYMCVCYS